MQLETLDQKLLEKERLYREELVKLQTNSDRDMLELRRKLDRMDLRYQEQIEKKQEEHETEIGESMRFFGNCQNTLVFCGWESN